MLYVDVKYLNQISNRFELFKRKDNYLFNVITYDKDNFSGYQYQASYPGTTVYLVYCTVLQYCPFQQIRNR